MAKKKAKTAKKSGFGKPSEWSYAKWAVVLLVVGLTSYLLFGYLPAERARDAERKEFAENKAQIEQIAKKLAQRHQPTEEESRDYCRYQSAKFEKGDLYCHVVNENIYKNIDASKANEIMNSVATEAGNGKLTDGKHISGRVGEEAQAEFNNNETGQYFYQTRGEKCSISYYFMDLVEYEDTKSKNLRVSISCSKVSHAEYFPLRK